MGWDESATLFTLGTTDASGGSTGSIGVTKSSLVAHLVGNVSGASTVSASNLSVTEAGTFSGTLFGNGVTSLKNTMVSGITSLKSTLIVAKTTQLEGITTLNNKLYVRGNTDMSGTLDISGICFLNLL